MMDPITDWELVKLHIEKCREFVNPKLFREINSRGLYNIINFLPNDYDLRETVAYSRMVKAGKLPMDHSVAEEVSRLNRIDSLKEKMFKTKSTEKSELIEIIKELSILLQQQI